MKNSIQKISFIVILIGLLSHTLYAFIGAHNITLTEQKSEIILPDGRIIQDKIACDASQIYISSELMSSIVGEPIYWSADEHTLYVGNIPTASVMSDRVKVYHYDYDDIHAFLYCPDAKVNKAMTMAGKVHHTGYYFSNIFSASFNLDGAYEKITGSLGLEDFKSSDGQVDFYLDDTLIKSCSLEKNSLPEKIELSVAGGSKLTLVFSNFKHNTQIDFVDVYIE